MNEWTYHPKSPNTSTIGWVENLGIPDILVATHVDLLELAVGQVEVLSHLNSHVLWQHGEKKPFLKENMKLASTTILQDSPI